MACGELGEAEMALLSPQFSGRQSSVRYSIIDFLLLLYLIFSQLAKFCQVCNFGIMEIVFAVKLKSFRGGGYAFLRRVAKTVY